LTACVSTYKHAYNTPEKLFTVYRYELSSLFNHIFVEFLYTT
jgi:hypothetical protein